MSAFDSKDLAGPQAIDTIRSATSADADAVFALVQQFATSFRSHRDAFDLGLRELLSDGSAWIAVAERGDEIVGYGLGFDHATLFAGGRVAWLEEIMVQQEHRRQGLGARLVAAFEHWATNRGAKLVALATRRATPFYAALGY